MNPAKRSMLPADTRIRLTVIILVFTAIFFVFTFMPSTKAEGGQTLSLSPNQGYPGTVVSVSGEGYNSFVVDINFSGTCVTSSLGFNTIQAEFAVPSLPPGIYTVTASDGRGDFAEAKFTITVPPFPQTAWLEKYGDRDIESVSNVIQTNDGGFAFLDQGWAHQFTFVPATFYKVNSSGGLEWAKSLGLFSGGSLVQTSDEGYAILGQWSTYGTSYEFTPTLIKTNSAGNIEWVKNYSTAVGSELLLTNDGGFAMLRGNPNLDFPPPNLIGGNLVATLTKTDSYGRIQWTANYSEPAVYNTITQIAQTSDHGFIMVGTTSFNGTNDTPNLYIWALKTDNQGKLQWNRLFGQGPTTVIANQSENIGAFEGLNRRTSGDNEGVSVAQTSDGCYVITGVVYPGRDYSWSSLSYGSTPNTAKTLMVKIDAKGNTLWNHTYDEYEISPVIQTSDNGFAFASSKGISKTDENGTLQWNKDDITFPSLGSVPYLVGASSLIETSDGSFSGIGVGTLSQSWQGNIYLFKTEPFLPLPTATPIPEPAVQTNDSALLDLAVLLSIAIISISLLLIALRRRGRSKVE